MLALARFAGDADGADPLSEHALLRLRDRRRRPGTCWPAPSDGTLTGYAHLDTTGADVRRRGGVGGAPGFRRRGTGRALARGVLAGRSRPGAGLGAR